MSDARVRVVTRPRDGGGKTDAILLDPIAALADREHARIETNNNMGRLIQVDVDNVVPGECRVAIEPTALHKRGRLNNQSSNILDLVGGTFGRFCKNPSASSRSSALFLLHQHCLC